MDLYSLFIRVPSRSFLFVVHNLLWIASVTSLTAIAQTDGEETDQASIDFFESKVRPILIEHCFACHSQTADKLQAGLRLDSREAILSGGDSGPAMVVNQPRESMLIKAIRYEGTEMPPDKKLSNDQIEAISKWIEMGAPWPSTDAQQPLSDTQQGKRVLKNLDWDSVRREHWAWKPIERPCLPQVVRTDWIQSPIDAFVLAELEAASMPPNPPADANILLRRMYLDLIGIPPTKEQTAAFMASEAIDRRSAVAVVIDELLASPMYGQRWGRHWLDVARYSDGFGGFLDTGNYPHAWHYRDWVIDAFNNDLPWSDFVRLQLAGDIVGRPKDFVATGFLALGPNYQSDGGDPQSIAQAKSETLDDRVDTLTRGMLGLTVSCARCHDHKFDPIPQQDYYSLAGVFNNSSEQTRPYTDPDTAAQHADVKAQLVAKENELLLASKLGEKEGRELRTDEQARVEELKSQRDAIANNPVLNIEFAHSLFESGNGDMKVAIRGNLRQEGELAPRRFLRLISGSHPLPFTDGSGRRELAEAMVSPSNPLTARVFVNRVWMHHFGEAIVRTPSNFGTLGQPPTHPQLLDFLAATLFQGEQGINGSIKSLHRLIMSSSVYQMSSQIVPENYGRDGDNRLLWRMNPRRMDVESWRDSLLAVTQELDTSPGFPPIEDLNHSLRRSVYAKVSRNGDQFASDAFLRTFDFPLMRATVENRPRSIVPQQFLFLLNSEFVVNRAKAFAARLAKMADTEEQRLDLAYQILYSRLPTEKERGIALAYLNSFDKTTDSTEATQDRPLSSWVQYAQVLLSSNEFMFVR